MIRNELRQTRKALCIWTGIMLLLCAFSYFEWQSFRDSLEELMGMINRFPRLFLILFGMRGSWNGMVDLFCCIYFWLVLVGYVYAIYSGVTCMGREYKTGTFEYLLTKPVSKAQIMLAKAAASGINLMIFAAFGGAGCYLFGVDQLHIFSGVAPIVLIAIGMFLTQMFLFSAGLLTAALVNSHRTVNRWGAVLLMLFYVIYFVVEYTENFALRYLTPLEYFNVYDVAERGISCIPVLITVIFAALSVKISIARWSKREVYLC